MSLLWFKIDSVVSIKTLYSVCVKYGGCMIFYEIMINSKQALTSLERYSAIMRNPASRTCFMRLMGYCFTKICN